jgi:hypothetical protein
MPTNHTTNKPRIKRRRVPVRVDPVPTPPAYPRLSRDTTDAEEYSRKYNDMLDRRLRRLEEEVLRRQQQANHKNRNIKK